MPVVTFDALHSQTAHARFLVEDKHAHYIALIKGNQPTLHQWHLNDAALASGVGAAFGRGAASGRRRPLGGRPGTQGACVMRPLDA
ncbi:hypothetical protein [Streptomyces sp. Caat 7-52]|uniref:hypothetical protein n=1 Tax=Streptomyces sp. Caat 7-52 TaxID=2949637 RepID=UPI002034C9B8|nr:hypothetical protein [Streptomyces sp. Caat 7-52]